MVGSPQVETREVSILVEPRTAAKRTQGKDEGMGCASRYSSFGEEGVGGSGDDDHDDCGGGGFLLVVVGMLLSTVFRGLCCWFSDGEDDGRRNDVSVS